MTGFNTQATNNDYRIQVYTDNPIAYAMVQDYVRRCLDWEQGERMARENDGARSKSIREQHQTTSGHVQGYLR